MDAISDVEFAQFRRLIFDNTGISLAENKKAMVTGRLAVRLAHHGFSSYEEYFRILASAQAGGELQTAIDLLTTNETYFFREPKHFEFLRKLVGESRDLPGVFRVWSAAGSSGEEAYSIAMLLEDLRPAQRWEVLCSDISTRMLKRAHRGQYGTARMENMPPGYLQRFCLKGHGEQEGTVLVKRELRRRLEFRHINLNAPLPEVGLFDVIFLRNVMIYFDLQTKRQVVARLYEVLRPGGYLFIGHSENLTGVSEQFNPIAPAIFRKS